VCGRQAVQALLEGRLLGTGNVVRQLATLGFALRFEQSALHEFDFSVGALAVDLRDGVRLCKLTEMLTGANLSPVRFLTSTMNLSADPMLALQACSRSRFQDMTLGLSCSSAETDTGSVYHCDVA
jgi:hypothetical protein